MVTKNARNRKQMLTLAVAGASLAALGQGAFGATWRPGSFGNWSNTSATGWNGAYPNAIGAVAQYSDSASDAGVTLDVTGITLGTLTNTNRPRWTINNGSADTLTLQVATGNATISQGSRGALVVNPNLVVNSDLVVTEVSDSGGSLTLNGAITGTGNVTLTNNATTGVGGSPLSVASINSTGTAAAGGAAYVKVGTIGANVTQFNKTGIGNLGIFGTVTLADTASNIAATTLTLDAGGVLTLDNSTNTNNNRVQAAVNMNGGALIGKGAITESFGAITAAGPRVSKITVDPNDASNTASLSFGGYTNTSTTGIVLFRGASMGSAPGAGVGSVFITSPTLTGSGSAGTSTVGILKHAIGATTIAGVGSGLVTYDAANGVRLLDTAAEYSATLAANANVRLTGSVASATQTINSLTIANGAAMTGASVVTITSGDIFVEPSISPTVGGKWTTATGTGFNFVTLGDLTASGDLTSTASVPLQKNGAGTLNLTGLSTNSLGTTTVNEGVLNVNSGTGKVTSVTVNGGTFKVTGNNRVSDTATVTVNGAGTYDINGTTDTIGGLAGTGTVTGGSGTTASMTINQTATLTVNNKLTGNLNVIQRGAGTMIIAGTANDYTGYTGTNGGTNFIKAGATNALPITTSLQLGNSDNTLGTFDLNGFNQQVGAIVGNLANTSVITNTGGSLKTFTVSSDTVDSTYSGQITGANLALTKAGSKTLTLGSAGTYSYGGATTVNGGTLLVNGSLTNCHAQIEMSGSAQIEMSAFYK